MKKSYKIIGFTLVILLAFSSGVGAASKMEKVQAYLNHGISIILDGAPWTPKDVNQKSLTPITYNGSTYVPLRAVSEAAGVFVDWNNELQQITMITKDAPATGEVLPFNKDTVKHIPWGLGSQGITRNKEDLKFGNTQYEAAFAVSEVGIRGVGFKVKQGAKKLNIMVGFKDDDPVEAKYTVKDRSGQSLATGKVKNNTVEMNQIELPLGVTELYIEFIAPIAGDGMGFIIWDGSTIEF